MKKEEMLKAIGNIDDQFVIDAETKSDNKPVKQKRSSAKWVKWAGGIAAVLAVCVIGVSAFPMFFGAQKSAPEMMTNSSYRESLDLSVNKGSYGGFKKEESYQKDNSLALEGKEGTSAPDAATQNLVDSVAKQNVKLIYTADLQLQTTKFDESFANISALVNQYGGYFEKSSVDNGGMYYAVYKTGYYVIRIPAGNYRVFLDAAGDSGHVVGLSESVKDIGEMYFNIESQMETLKIKEERLQELLKKATNLSDIITIESELSNVEQQLKMYGTDLNHYDSLIGYSTINLTLQEVSAFSNSAYKESLGERLSRALRSGVIGFVEGIEDFIVWVGYNIIGIIILAAIVFVVWKFHLIRRLIRKITGKQ